jgi:hypothetical protein
MDGRAIWGHRITEGNRPLVSGVAGFMAHVTVFALPALNPPRRS